MPRPASARDDATTSAPAWRRCVGALGRLLRTLFVHQLRVRRRGGRLTVRLEERADTRQADIRAAAGAAARYTDPTLVELAALLDAAPRSRALLRYLAAVEHGLKHKDRTGLFLFEAEPARLRAALRQLDGLAPQPLSAGLAALRVRLADAIGAHEQRAREREMLMPRSALMHSDRLEVGEASASDFDRASAQWRAKDPAS